jgi:uncharacterized membrane protein YkoI
MAAEMGFTMQLNVKGLSVAIVSLCLAGTSIAAGKTIHKSDLPAAVAKTADQQIKGATVIGYKMEKEDGKIEYELQMTLNGHSKDVTIAPDGQLLEVEEQVVLEELPANVRVALRAKAGKGKITKVESLTKQGMIVAYEAQVLTDGKHTEVQVGPDGKTLNHKE